MELVFEQSGSVDTDASLSLDANGPKSINTQETFSTLGLGFVSGIRFYDECGYLLLGYKNTESTYDVETAAKLGEKLHRFDPQEMAEKFPYLSTKENHTGTYMPVNSGYINPRQMKKAQKLLAERGGCDVINDVVKRVIPIGRDGYEIEVESSGQLIKGKKVLAATGCFTHCRDLLPRGMELDIDRNGTTILLVLLASFLLNQIEKKLHTAYWVLHLLEKRNNISLFLPQICRQR